MGRQSKYPRKGFKKTTVKWKCLIINLAQYDLDFPKSGGICVNLGGSGDERIFQNQERCNFTLKRFRMPSTMNQKRHIFRRTSFKFKNTQGKQKILKFTRKRKKNQS